MYEYISFLAKEYNKYIYPLREAKLIPIWHSVNETAQNCHQPLLSGIERSSWHDSLSEWGRTKIFHGNWPPKLIHRPSREIKSDFPCLFCGWDLVEFPCGNYTSALFWQRVAPTAPFNMWDKRLYSAGAEKHIWGLSRTTGPRYMGFLFIFN